LLVIVIAAAAARLARLDDGETREIRLFLAGSMIGAVYLYSARLADGLAQVGAGAAAMLILSLLATQRDRLGRLIGFLQRQNPTAVAALLWIAALLLLVLNLAVKSARGAATPQVGPIAPYQVAAVLMLAASGIARATQISLLSRAGMFHAVSLAICLALMFQTDAGTLALTLLGLAIVFAVLGEPVSLLIVIGLCVSALMFARSPLAPRLVKPFSTRIADRITGWAGHSRPNDQMIRADETIKLAGWTGHAGAARPVTLIGTEASRDYMPGVIGAQGGIGGMLITSTFMLTFVAEFLRRLHRVRETLPRAMCAALFAAFASNVLIATLWIDHTTPLAGIPAPLLARAGSHLTAAALVLGIVAFGTRSEGGSLGNRLAA
jgi:cell division protein FtsW (lipid II flippase)